VTDFEDYEALSDDNTATPPAGAPEQHARKKVNDILREIMGVTRRDWEGTASGGGPWRHVTKGLTTIRLTNTSFRVEDSDARAFYAVGRKLKLDQTDDGWCFVASADFNDPHTDVVVEDFDVTGEGTVQASIDSACQGRLRKRKRSVRNPGSSDWGCHPGRD
jgi:hypothetical protein